MKFRIEAATLRDVAQILTMIRDFAEFENLSEFCKVTEEKLTIAMFGEQPCVEGLVAFDDQNNAIGYALFYPNFASFRGQRGIYLEDLYVVPEYRGQGVGFELLKYLACVGQRRGCERMDWQVLDWNESAIKFYQKLGAVIDPFERHCKIVGQKFLDLTSVRK